VQIGIAVTAEVTRFEYLANLKFVVLSVMRVGNLFGPLDRFMSSSRVLSLIRAIEKQRGSLSPEMGNPQIQN